MLEIYLTQPTSYPVTHLRSDRRTINKWPYQLPPECSTTFNLWTRCLRNLFLNTSGRKLRKPLGAWTVTPTKSESIWEAYISIDRQSLILSTPTSLTQYSVISEIKSCTTTFTDTNPETIASVPDNYIPVDVSHNRNHYVAIHSHRYSQALLTPDLLTCVHDNIQTAIWLAPIWQRDILQHFRIHDIDILLQHLRQPDDKLYIVTDGGMKDNRGSFGVAIGTNDVELVSIEGPAPGYSEHANSYRSEAYGMLAGFNFLCLLMKTYNIMLPAKRKLLVFCDNLALVKCVQQIIVHQTYPRMFIRSESDVILQIQSDIIQLQSYNIDVILEHVKGHQDDHHEYHELSRESQLNISADAYATNYLLEGILTKYCELPANAANFYLNNHIITRNIKHEIRIASRSPDLREYMMKHLKRETSLFCPVLSEFGLVKGRFFLST
jgi:hypothetical protein